MACEASHNILMRIDRNGTRHKQVAAVQPVGAAYLHGCATALVPKWSLVALLQGPVLLCRGHAGRQVKIY